MRARSPRRRRRRCCLPQRRRWPRLLVEVALFAGLGWGAMAWSPFGLSEHSEAATRQILYQALGPLYESDGTETITVVLLDDAAMGQLAQPENPVSFIANDWPVRYADHAAVLQTLLAYRPRAIFVDMYFLRERKGDQTAGQLYSLLQMARMQGHTEIFVGNGFSAEPSTPMQRRLAEQARLVPIFWKGSSATYPLQVPEEQESGDSADNDREEATERELTKQKYTDFGAYALYRALCVESSPRWKGCKGAALVPPDDSTLAPLSVLWGSGVPPKVPPEDETADETANETDAAPDAEGGSRCTPAPDDLLANLTHLGRFVATGLLGGEMAPQSTRCPYHTTLPVDQLLAMDWSAQGADTDLECRLADGVVFYGGSFSGMADLIPSPVHGQLPGVYLHAMALDNLLRFGRGYIRDREDGLLINAVVWLAVVVPVVTAMRRRPTPVVGAGRIPQRAHWLRRFLRWLLREAVFLVFVGMLLLGLTLAALLITRHEPANFVELFGLMFLLRLLLRESLLDALARWWHRRRRSGGLLITSPRTRFQVRPIRRLSP